MVRKRFVREGRQIIIHTDGEICQSKEALLESDVFETIAGMYIDELDRHESSMLEDIFDAIGVDGDVGRITLLGLIRELADNSVEALALDRPAARMLADTPVREAIHEFVKGLYNHWRTFDRFMILHSEPGPSSFDQRPYRSFNDTIEALTHLMRSVYRDLCENITGEHPSIYRQVAAGCNVGLIAVPKETRLPDKYKPLLGAIPFIRQAWFAPPMIIDPPMNRREGEFQRVEKNPLEKMELRADEWICYPAQVGPLIIFIYVHQRFMGLGCSLANLFELADDGNLRNGPDAIFLYGAPLEAMAEFGALPAIFCEDAQNDILVAAIPGEDRFGYFGYLKKMTLTLHNIVMMKRGRMPYHGAMVRIVMHNGRSANLLLMGDTATGKSETIEALRAIGGEYIEELITIADDMGSLDLATDGGVMGYGTEIGAFVRLDDLGQGYAFGQIDRSIIMSPQKVNARVVLPVTDLKCVLKGHRVDFMLYANNYEGVDAKHPIVERFADADSALAVFREGKAMSKGTTTSTGLVSNYFANIFGPEQYKDLHDKIAKIFFKAAFDTEIFVGMMRTRLGIKGFESQGPQEAAKTLLNLISCEKG